MKNLLIPFFALVTCVPLFGQTPIQYEIDFEGRAHHQASVKITYRNLEEKVLEIRMSRSSPGRYAIHEFAKNVYEVKAVDKAGNELPIYRPNPYQWNIAGHQGYAEITYTLFADRGDGTYTQIDETHAHLNMPATFMFARGMEQRPIHVRFHIPDDSNWRVATQLKDLGNGNFYAPNFQYFMDSPTEVSDFMERSFTVDNGGKQQIVRMALHHSGTEEEATEYFERIKKIVLEEQKVFGELPNFDFGEYTFLLCYLPNVSGDGMEHRNSTVCTSTRSLRNGGMDRNLGTISHEFLHAWNIERIRPQSLEPFDFENANMSGELWFGEGFTSYYTGLVLARAGLRGAPAYLRGVAGTLNYVINYPGRAYRTPIEMSYQAPFVDAASSIDPEYFSNTFISYYSYGSALGLGLDLMLRNLQDDKHLDGFMQLVWERFGKTEVPYTVGDLQATLADYAGADFSQLFFSRFIYDSQLPDYASLLASVGVEVASSPAGLFGAGLRKVEDGHWEVADYIRHNTPAYIAGLEKGDEILAVDGQEIAMMEDPQELFSRAAPGTVMNIDYVRFGQRQSTKVTIAKDPTIQLQIIDKPKDKNIRARQAAWLGIE